VFLVRPIACTSERIAHALSQRLGVDLHRLTSVNQFLDAPRDADAVFFVDRDALAALAKVGDVPGPVIALCDDELSTASAWLRDHRWLSHVVRTAMLEYPMGGSHLGNVVSALATGTRGRLLDWVRPTLEGQRIRLTHASERSDQLAEMAFFFVENGIAKETSEQLCAAADALLINAFYEAPVAAGAVTKPIPRRIDVALPEDKPSDTVYGCSDDFAIVRVRDPFGSLSREKIIDALAAGSGLAKVVSAVSFVAISVARGHHTDVLVGIGKHEIREPRPFAIHLFFKDSAKRRVWKLLEEDSGQQSFTSSGDPWDES
jgi:hypothetical protein